MSSLRGLTRGKPRCLGAGVQVLSRPMRALPVSDPGTPDLRSPRRYLAWLMTQQKSSVALGILWGC